MNNLYDINKQMASGLKIQNSYEDSGIYVDTMRLNNEVTTLDQTQETSSKAQTFTQNTDSVLTQFVKSLEDFKTKLIQASSSSNSTTSLEALANELEALRTGMIGLGNTSIDGQYLFSGSALEIKPLNADGIYNGNDGSLTALVGSGVELSYNINGQSLFLGRDNDYNRVVSTNVVMYNQSKLNPDVMVETSGNTSSKKVYLTEDDTIRDLVGDTNADATDDPKAVFYLSGRKSDGTTFANTIAIDTSSSVSDLLESIGSAYGNTTKNKVVDVSMNAVGQIEIKDLKKGNQLLEMNLAGAIDRTALAGQTGDALQIMNIDNLLTKTNVDIIAFNKSNYSTSASTADLMMESAPTGTAGFYALSFPGIDTSTKNIIKTTSLQDLFSSDVDHLDFGSTSFSTSGKNVQDLMTAIETEYGLGAGGATLVDGQIVTNNSSITIIPMDASNALAHGDDIPDALNYARRGFEKDGNELTSNISQIIKSSNDYATASTKLVDVAGVDSLNGKQLVFDFTDKNGIQRTGTLNLDISDTTFTSDLNGNGRTTQISTDVDFEDADMASGDTITIGGLTLTATGAVSKAEVLAGFASLSAGDTTGNAITNGTWSGTLTFDTSSVAGTSIAFTNAAEETPSVNATGTVSIPTAVTSIKPELNEVFSIYNGVGKSTKADEMTYQQLMDVISMVTSGNYPNLGVSDQAASNIQTAIDEATDGDPLTDGVAATASAKSGVSAKTAEYIQQAIDFGIEEANATAISDTTAAAKAKASKDAALVSANLEEYNISLKAAKNSVEVSLDSKGRIDIVDKNASETKIEFTLYDKSTTDFTGIGNTALSFMANDAVTIANPSVNLFDDLESMIEAVRSGTFRMDGDSSDPRNIGIQNSINQLSHLLDHVTKEQTTIGSYSNALTSANERAATLSLNVQTIRSSIIGVDDAEAYLQFNQLSISYQALLSTVSKINSMSLLNYM